MVKKKYIDAEQLAHRLRQLATNNHVPMMGSSGYYGSNSELQNALNSMVQSMKMEIARDVGQHVSHVLMRLASEVEASAIDGGQCMLCQQRDDDVIPGNIYYGCGTESAAIRAKCG